MPSHFEIFNYWKDKYITNEGEVISAYQQNSIEVITDWGEPECWCCKKFVDKLYGWNDYENNLQTIDGLKEIWNYKYTKSLLNRCHIVAKQFNGSNHPSNLFLLCEECHLESPDTIYPNMFFAWIYGKRNKCGSMHNFYEFTNEIKQYCDTLSINYDDVFNKILASNIPIIEIMKKDAGIHAGKILPSSIAACLINHYLSLN